MNSLCFFSLLQHREPAWQCLLAFDTHTLNWNHARNISNPSQILNAFSAESLCNKRSRYCCRLLFMSHFFCFPSFFCSLALCVHFCDTVSIGTWFTAQCKQKILFNIWRFFFSSFLFLDSSQTLDGRRFYMFILFSHTQTHTCTIQMDGANSMCMMCTMLSSIWI